MSTDNVHLKQWNSFEYYTTIYWELNIIVIINLIKFKYVYKNIIINVISKP